jgi:hypothetical protein
MTEKEIKKVSDIQEQVWEVADEILATGRYPTRDDICKALKKSPHLSSVKLGKRKIKVIPNKGKIF